MYSTCKTLLSFSELLLALEERHGNKLPGLSDIAITAQSLLFYLDHNNEVRVNQEATHLVHSMVRAIEAYYDISGGLPNEVMKRIDFLRDKPHTFEQQIQTLIPLTTKAVLVAALHL